MADLISQDDLDALWGSLSGDESKGATPAKEEKAPDQTGISQADLDALWGDLGLPTEETHGAGSAAPAPAPLPMEESSGGESLSQEEIDRLLAEMGK